MAVNLADMQRVGVVLVTPILAGVVGAVCRWRRRAWWSAGLDHEFCGLSSVPISQGRWGSPRVAVSAGIPSRPATDWYWVYFLDHDSVSSAPLTFSYLAATTNQGRTKSPRPTSYGQGFLFLGMRPRFLLSSTVEVDELEGYRMWEEEDTFSRAGVVFARRIQPASRFPCYFSLTSTTGSASFSALPSLGPCAF
jgi:hypothetical protein